jgi:excisionase family DNA binding protein
MTLPSHGPGKWLDSWAGWLPFVLNPAPYQVETPMAAQAEQPYGSGEKEEPLETPQEVAIQWNCSLRTLRRVLKDGELPFIRIRGQIRIRPADRRRYERMHRSDGRF